jgi:hypothetical protein
LCHARRCDDDDDDDDDDDGGGKYMYMYMYLRTRPKNGGAVCGPCTMAARTGLPPFEIGYGSESKPGECDDDAAAAADDDDDCSLDDRDSSSLQRSFFSV